MNPEQPGFEFESESTEHKEEITPSQAPESEIIKMAGPDDDPRSGDVWHDVSTKREQYKANASRNVLSGKNRFADADGLSKHDTLQTKKTAGALVDQHRKKQFDEFYYKSMNFDERTKFMHKSQTERDRLFDEWRKGKK